MAEGGIRKENWDFDCPQFFDFCTGVEESTVNFNSLGGDSPALENQFNIKSKNILKNGSGTLINKNFKASTISTPINKSPFVNVNRQVNATDSEKLNEEKKRLSKSEANLNNVGRGIKVFKKNYPSIIRKRSLSEGDIRPKRKFPMTPKKIPATPMCLKRTQHRDKTKKIKSTEELELEKIAKLQSLTLKHLRFNEKNMKKLNMKPKPPTVPKLAPSKTDKREKSPLSKKFQKDLDDVIKKLKSNKNMRRFAVSSYPDVEFASDQPLQPRIDVPDDVQMAADEKNIAHELSFKRCPGHSGVYFHSKNSKNSALKPCNFNDRIKDCAKSFVYKTNVKANNENFQVPKAQFSHSFQTPHLKNQTNNKENLYAKIAPKSAGVIKKSFKY